MMNTISIPSGYWATSWGCCAFFSAVVLIASTGTSGFFDSSTIEDLLLEKVCDWSFGPLLPWLLSGAFASMVPPRSALDSSCEDVEEAICADYLTQVGNCILR